MQGQAYREQYEFERRVLAYRSTCYGPWDNFDPRSSHVIPALIRKCFEAMDTNESEIVCWGDGTATREFVYVGDCAEAVVLAAEKYDGAPSR